MARAVDLAVLTYQLQISITMSLTSSPTAVNVFVIILASWLCHVLQMLLVSILDEHKSQARLQAGHL